MPTEKKTPAGHGWSLGLKAARLAQVVARVEQGLSAQALHRLMDALDIDVEAAAALVGASPRTLARRRKSGRLTPEESDRLYRLARLFERAVEVLGTGAEARAWLKAPQWGLGGAVPLDYAKTEPGARAVETLLDRIDYGVLA